MADDTIDDTNDDDRVPPASPEDMRAADAANGEPAALEDTAPDPASARGATPPPMGDVPLADRPADEESPVAGS